MKRLFMVTPKEPFDKEFRGTIDGTVVLFKGVKPFPAKITID